MYVFNLFDIQSGGISLLFIGFCEAAVIGWGVGEYIFSLKPNYKLIFEVYCVVRKQAMRCGKTKPQTVTAVGLISRRQTTQLKNVNALNK